MQTEPNPQPVAETGFIDSIDSYFNQLPASVADAPVEPPQKPVEASEPKSKVTPADAPSDAPESTTDAKEAKQPADAKDDLLPELDSVDADLKDWTPQAARRFKELKAQNKALSAKMQELESLAQQKEQRLKELEALTETGDQNELVERVKQYEQQTMLSKLEQSHAYKTLVEQPLSELVNEADAIAAKYQISPDTLIDALAITDEVQQEERLAELLAEASDRDKFRVYKIIDEMKPILKQRQTLYENVQEALLEAQELEKQREQQTLAERASRRLEAAKAVADKLTSKMTFLSAFDGVDMQSFVKEAAAVDPTTLDPVQSTYHAIAARLLPKMASQYLNLQREIETLTERLAEYDRAAPRSGGNYASGSNVVNDQKSFLDAVDAAFGGR